MATFIIIQQVKYFLGKKKPQEVKAVLSTLVVLYNDSPACVHSLHRVCSMCGVFLTLVHVGVVKTGDLHLTITLCSVVFLLKLFLALLAALYELCSC